MLAQALWQIQVCLCWMLPLLLQERALYVGWMWILIPAVGPSGWCQRCGWGHSHTYARKYSRGTLCWVDSVEKMRFDKAAQGCKWSSESKTRTGVGEEGDRVEQFQTQSSGCALRAAQKTATTKARPWLFYGLELREGEVFQLNKQTKG